MSLLKQLIFLMKDFFFPSVCALCGGSLIGAVEIRYGLCEQCRQTFVPVSGRRCNLCGRPLISEMDFCLSCRSGQTHSYDRLWVLFPYTGKYRKLLSAYKFDKNIVLADFLAEKVLEILADPVFNNACIVPVPPRPGKIREIGWDQVDYLVKRLEKLDFRRVVCRCLKRRKSEVQKRLGRTERMKNLKGRICLRGKAPQIALVIDDVITTGSTMEVCSASLKEGGAQKVYGLCLFYD